MARILAIADEVAEVLYGDALQRLRPDVVLSCGDLPFEYLENLVTRAGVPLIYVLGNHDPDPRRSAEPIGAWPARGYALSDPIPRPQGCDSAEGRLLKAAGVHIAGLGGPLRYKEGPNQYTQGEMRRRALRLEARARLRRGFRRGVDVIITHAPPLGVGDARDQAHQGFAAFHRLVAQLRPRVLLHGHVHPVHRRVGDRPTRATPVVHAPPPPALGAVPPCGTHRGA